LNEPIADLEDYKAGNTATVLFKVNSAALSDDAKQQLDQMTNGSLSTAKLYFIAIQGFTDMAGSAEYNLELSQRRAEAAQTYLVAQHNVPVCRTRIVGLGKDKPVNEEKTGEERQQNRRVDVTLFSADSAGAAKSHTSMN
jgi:OmpA-OmpF porin, OOP family